MDVEESLRRDAGRIAAAVDRVDVDDLLRRVSVGLEGPPPAEVFEPVPGDCLPPADEGLSPLAEVRHHLRHALQSPSCARRAAELFELLGQDKEARICWRSAADAGDPDARDYVAEFIAPPPSPRLAYGERHQMEQLVEAFR